MQKYTLYLGQIPNGLYYIKTQHISAPKEQLGRSHKNQTEAHLVINMRTQWEIVQHCGCQRCQISDSYW